MSTAKVNLSATMGWVQLATAEDLTFAVENQGISNVWLNYAPAMPAVDAVGHLLSPGSLLPRLADGVLWGRVNNTDRTTSLVVTK